MSVLLKKNRRYSVGDLDARASEIASTTQRAAGKATPGDRIFLTKANHCDVVVLAVAISRAGFVPVAVSNSASDDGFQALVAKSDPKLVLFGGRFDSHTDHQIQAPKMEWPHLLVRELASLSENEDFIFAPLKYPRPKTVMHRCL